MLDRFIKKAYISFYEDKKIILNIDIIKNKKIIESKKKELEDKNELKNEIEIIKEDFTQYYISTIIDTINQGVIPSCSKTEYKKRSIDIENIKYICINNKYSFYVFLYDLINLKKELELDYIYSIFAPIDFFAKNKKNIFYVLILNKLIAILGYENNIPIYSEISYIEEDEELDEELEIIDDIDLDIDEEISEDIEEESQNLNLEEPSIEHTDIEYKIIEILKNSLKDYYENYSNDFLEQIIFLDTIDLNNTLTKIVNDELLMESKIIKFDLGKTLNKISEMENV